MLIITDVLLIQVHFLAPSMICRCIFPSKVLNYLVFYFWWEPLLLKGQVVQKPLLLVGNVALHK